MVEIEHKLNLPEIQQHVDQVDAAIRHTNEVIVNQASDFFPWELPATTNVVELRSSLGVNATIRRDFLEGLIYGPLAQLTRIKIGWEQRRDEALDECIDARDTLLDPDSIATLFERGVLDDDKLALLREGIQHIVALPSNDNFSALQNPKIKLVPATSGSIVELADFKSNYNPNDTATTEEDPAEPVEDMQPGTDEDLPDSPDDTRFIPKNPFKGGVRVYRAYEIVKENPGPYDVKSLSELVFEEELRLGTISAERAYLTTQTNIIPALIHGLPEGAVRKTRTGHTKTYEFFGIIPQVETTDEVSKEQKLPEADETTPKPQVEDPLEDPDVKRALAILSSSPKAISSTELIDTIFEEGLLSGTMTRQSALARFKRIIIPALKGLDPSYGKLEAEGTKRWATYLIRKTVEEDSLTSSEERKDLPQITLDMNTLQISCNGIIGNASYKPYTDLARRLAGKTGKISMEELCGLEPGQEIDEARRREAESAFSALRLMFEKDYDHPTIFIAKINSIAHCYEYELRGNITIIEKE